MSESLIMLLSGILLERESQVAYKGLEQVVAIYCMRQGETPLKDIIKLHHGKLSESRV